MKFFNYIIRNISMAIHTQLHAVFKVIFPKFQHFGSTCGPNFPPEDKNQPKLGFLYELKLHNLKKK